MKNKIRTNILLKYKLQMDLNFIPYYLVEEILHERKKMKRRCNV